MNGIGRFASLLVTCAALLVGTAAAQPIGELRIGINTLPRTIEPFFDTTTTALGVYKQIFDTLVRVDLEGQPIPWLAESWEVIDERTWELRLRDDVTWHDGKPFDANDVKYALDWTLDPDNTAPWAARIGLISEVEIVDDYTVRLHTREPWAALLQGLLVIHMIPENYYDSAEYSPATHAIGTGRYRFVEWVADDYLRLVAFEDSWQGEANVQAATFISMPTAVTRTSALQAGEIQIAYAVPPEQVPALEASGIQIVSQALGHSLLLTFYGTREDSPVNDARVRQALNHAVDKEAIVEFVMGGFGRVLDGQLVGPDGFGYNPDLEMFPYDPDRARELLAEAGYGDGFTLGFSGTVANYLKDREVAEAVAGMIEEIGVTVDLDLLEQSVWAEGLYSNTLRDMFMIGWQYSPAMDVTLPYTYFQCAPTSFADYICSEEFDTLYRESQAQFDAETRAELLRQASVVLHEEAPALFLHQLTAIFGVAPGLNGVEFRADNTLEFHDAAFE